MVRKATTVNTEVNKKGLLEVANTMDNTINIEKADNSVVNSQSEMNIPGVISSSA